MTSFEPEHKLKVVRFRTLNVSKSIRVSKTKGWIPQQESSEFQAGRRTELGQATECTRTTAELIGFDAEMLQCIDPKVAQRRRVLRVMSQVLPMPELSA